MLKREIPNKTMIKLLTMLGVMIGVFFIIFSLVLWLNRDTITIAAPPDRAVYEVPTDTEGKFCGGIAAIPCPTGYSCEIKATYPDAGGSCIKQ